LQSTGPSNDYSSLHHKTTISVVEVAFKEVTFVIDGNFTFVTVMSLQTIGENKKERVKKNIS
jgi:hypothetical protein